jgi:hypothetical protein
LTYGRLSQDLRHGNLDICEGLARSCLLRVLTGRRGRCARGHVEKECHFGACGGERRWVDGNSRAAVTTADDMKFLFWGGDTFGTVCESSRKDFGEAEVSTDEQGILEAVRSGLSIRRTAKLFGVSPAKV